VEESGTSGQGRGLAAGWKGLIASAASAALHALAFPPFDVPETAYVFAVPLLLYALFSRPAKGEGWSVFAGGWISWAVLLVWLRNVTGHLDIPLGGLLGWFAVVALSAIVAVFWWVWFTIVIRLIRRSAAGGVPARLVVLLTGAALWVLLEWLRTVLFTGFPWLLLSVSQWQQPLLLQITSITGGSGLSFVLVAFNLGLAFYLFTLWTKRKGRWYQRISPEFYVALLLLFASIGYGLHSSGAGSRGRIDGPRIAFVQPNAGAVEKWDPSMVRENLDVLADLTTYAQYLGAELVLWPESPTPMAVKGNASMQGWVESLSSQTGLPLLIGNIAREEGTDGEPASWYNAVFTVDPETGVDTETYYAKRHLVPFGEYVPLARMLPFLRKVVPVPGDFFPGESARPLRFPEEGADFGKIGVLICYEDIFPALARRNVRAGADWHYVATNNVWYGEGAAARQHAAHSVLRAVETRRPVVRCGNAGWSGWIDEFGHVRHVMLDDRNSIFFQGVEAVPFTRSRFWSGRTSVYVRHGDWFVAVCGGLVLLGAGWVMVLQRPRPDPDSDADLENRKVRETAT
jgi:apolipoprotein N-acyltransferase